jgi:putative membrane protein
VINKFTDIKISVAALNKITSIIPSNVKEPPYSKFDSSKLILRDKLALDRTALANERTLLAYLRSGVALLIAGTSIMNFSQEDWFRLVGIACIPIGIITGIIGVVRYRKMNRSISFIDRQSKIKKAKEDESEL